MSQLNVESLSRPMRLGIGAAGLALLLGLLVLVARVVYDSGWFQEFLVAYPGHQDLPVGTGTGLPAWLNWQHFLNAFFLVMIIKSGWRVRTVTRPTAYWTPRWAPKGTSKISLDLWFHLSTDVLWLLNGIVFVFTIFATGHWVRIVPTSWDILPNAFSVLVQYLSFQWPTENGWVNYNSLQVLAYFAIVFIASPLAALSGARMSPAWPKAGILNKSFPMEVARAVHFPVMLFFVAFVVSHVALVLATGARRNLNHMFASQSSESWVGFWIFLGALLLMAGAWWAARPLLLRPLAALTGKVGR